MSRRDILYVLNVAHKPVLRFLLGEAVFYYIDYLDKIAFRTRNILVTYNVEALIEECEENNLFENTWLLPEEIVADYFVKDIVMKKLNRKGYI